MNETYEYIITLGDFSRVVEIVKTYITNNPDAKLAVDCETVKHWKIKGEDDDKPARPIKNKKGELQGSARLIQIGLDPRIKDKQYIIDVFALRSQGLTDKDIGQSLKILEQAKVIGHNFKYDYQFLRAQFGIKIPPENILCTQLISQVLYAGDKLMKHGLAACYNEFIPVNEFKTLTGFFQSQYEKTKQAMQSSDWSGVLTTAQLQYAADDVRIIFYLFTHQKRFLDDFIGRYEKELRGDASIIQVIKLECKLIPVVAMMELRGVKFDIARHRENVIKYLEEKCREAEVEITKYFPRKDKVVNQWCLIRSPKTGEPIRGKEQNVVGKLRIVWEVDSTINIGSWQQVKSVLASIGIHVADTSEDTLRKHINEHPAISWILQWKKANSFLTKFGEKYIDLCTDRGYIHANWMQMGTEFNAISTGRFSSNSPNLQQIPARDELFKEKIKAGKLIRSSFIAEDGYVFVSADFSQIEPRVTAELCKERSMIDRFKKERKVDLHGMVAMALLDLPEPPKEGDYRRDFIGKTANLGLSYGMGAIKLAKFLFDESEGKVDWTKNSYQLAKENVARYFEMFPGIRKRMEEFERRVARLPETFQSLAPFKGRKPFAVVFTPMGRPRRFCLTAEQERDVPEEYLNRNSPPLEGKKQPEYKIRLQDAAREGYNATIQGCSADITKIALLVDYEFEKLGWDVETEGVIMAIHDEIIVHVREEHKEQAKIILEKAMVEAGQNFLTEVPVIVNPAEGKNLGDCKK